MGSRYDRASTLCPTPWQRHPHSVDTSKQVNKLSLTKPNKTHTHPTHTPHTPHTHSPHTPVVGILSKLFLLLQVCLKLLQQRRQLKMKLPHSSAGTVCVKVQLENSCSRLAPSCFFFVYFFLSPPAPHTLPTCHIL